ncbi:hypothetical protein SDC9_165528 [bioreactor metagenome]|uniref:Uncharacterized protein n=1 Tax=bioreactor metagenome TaxID=1076179 RepID=A0A645FWY4_9ZZZZ
MKFFLVISKLAHVAKDGNFSSDGHIQHVDRCLHGYRIGIVAVIQDDQAIRLDDIVASRDGGKSFDSGLNLFGSEMKSITDCRACQRIRDHVGAWQWNDAFKGGFIRQMDRAGGSSKSQGLDIVSIELAILSKSEKDRSGAFDRANLREQVIVPV